MKKTWFLAVLTIMLGTNAFADCKVTTCSTGGGSDKSILSTSGVVGNDATGQCYRCNWGDNDYECGEGTIIAIKHPDYTFNHRINGFFYCSDAGDHNDTWTNHNPTNTCSDSEVRSTAQNAEKFFAIDGTQTGAIQSTTGDSIVLGAGNHGCVMYKCKTGFVPTADKTNCIVDTRNSNCKSPDGNTTYPNGHTLQPQCKNANDFAKGKLESLEHIKANAKCTMTCATNGWDLTLNNDSCETRYGPNSTKKKCVKSQSAIDDENAAAARRKNCIDSGGTWTNNQCACDANKNLTQANNGTCTCVAGYTYINPSNKAQGCEPTDIEALRQVCNTVSDATWNEIEKLCVCNAGDDYFFNTSTKKCEPTLDYAKCQALSTIATWDSINKKCRCKDPNKELNADKTKCIETPESKARRETFEITQRTKSIYSELVSIHDKFRDKKSVWKDAEGNFNTARLASDSIAGVVLGTAGGLITSHVVKKNQVENGFEDIKCTIGGQNVAEWGDQFRVGIQ